jgi:outer membrane receptor protein involved in Fe transport
MHAVNRRNHGSLKFAFFATVAGIAALGAGVANAQEERDSGSAGLEEVFVTATKRAESIQEVGMSITALADTELERMGAETLIDFAVRVPNLGMAYEADGRFDSSSPSIRGVFGTDTTGFYIDDTPVSASILPRVMDIERIEVLRGPQGSLYGAKSMGGTIRMITRQPDLNESEGSVHAGLSTVKEGDENYNIDASVNVPLIAGKFALRMAAYYGANSGIFDREYIPSWIDSGGTVRPSPGPAFATRENVDDETYYGGQIAGKIALTDRVGLDLKFVGQKIDADGLPFADIEASNTTERRFFDLAEPGTDRWFIASGTLNWNTDAGTLVSSTSWYDRETSEWEEETSFLHFLFDQVIGLPIDPLPSLINTTEKYQSFSQELRFSSSFDGPLNFIAGVFYQDAEYDHHYPRAVQTGLAAAIDAFTGVPGLGQDCDVGFCLTDDDLIFTDTQLTKTKESAIFGELTWEVSERWSITAGGRFYDNKVHAVDASDGFANSGPSSYDEKQSETGFNPKVLVQAQINKNLNLYTSAAKGFRIGGVNGNLPPGLCGPELDELGIDPSNATTYDSDTLWSYELGFKSSLADNRVTFNGAAFFIDWSNIQQLNRLACGFQFTQNAGKAESKGFELELMAAPVRGLTLSLGVGYTKAEITDDGGVAGVSEGDKIQGVPDWTFNAGTQYVWPVSAGWEGLVRADLNHYGDSYSSNNATSAAEQRLREAWTALNLRAGLMNERWELTLFVDNVTDERANLADSRSIAAETPGRQRLVASRPLTYGLEGRIRF